MSACAVRKFRLKRGITQGDLARAAKTTRCKVARIEAGAQACDLGLATRIAEALETPVERLFPGSGKYLKKLQTSPALSNKDLDALADVGIDAELNFWSITFRLRGGTVSRFQVGGREMRRLFSVVQRTEGHGSKFAVFDSEERRVLVNLDHALVCHFTFEPRDDRREQESGSFEANLQLADGSDALAFSLEGDDETDDEEADIGQLAHIFLMASLQSSDEIFVAHFRDGDGEDVFIRMDDAAFFSVPLDAVMPSVIPDFDEEEESDSQPDPPAAPPTSPEGADVIDFHSRLPK